MLISKKKNMKIKDLLPRVCLLISSSLTVVSCNDFLDREPLHLSHLRSISRLLTILLLMLFLIIKDFFLHMEGSEWGLAMVIAILTMP